VQSRHQSVNSQWLSLWEPSSTPTKSTSLNRSPKNLSQVIMSTTSSAGQNLVKISLYGLLGKQVKYNTFFFIYTPFLSDSPIGQIASQIFTLDGSNDADSRKGVPCLICCLDNAMSASFLDSCELSNVSYRQVHLMLAIISYR